MKNESLASSRISMSSDADPDHARQTHFDLVMDKLVDKVLVEKVDKKVDKMV